MKYYHLPPGITTNNVRIHIHHHTSTCASSILLLRPPRSIWGTRRRKHHIAPGSYPQVLTNLTNLAFDNSCAGICPLSAISKCMVPTAMWLRRGLKSYRMFCAATPPRQQGKKTKLERHGFVLHTVKMRFFGPIPINKLQVKPWFDHENISVSCSSIEWICFTSIKYCSGIHFVENLL